jgi:hypothetical protein
MNPTLANMKRTRYYFATEANDDAAYKEAIMLASRISNGNPEFSKIILLALTKDNVGWLERIFGDAFTKKLFQGATVQGCSVPLKIETRKTYRGNHSSQDIVITMGMDSDDVMKLEDQFGVGVIIAIPWLKEGLSRWIDTWGPIEARSNSKASTYPELACIVKTAFASLSKSINLSTGIHNPFDEELAKTYIRVLHKYVGLNGEQVVGYLVRELHWQTTHAEEVKGLIDKLNSGKTFKGGEKTGLQNYYNRWKAQCEQTPA